MFLTYFWLAGRIKGRVFIVSPVIHATIQTGKHLDFNGHVVIQHVAFVQFTST